MKDKQYTFNHLKYKFRTITKKDWMEEGKKLFGEDMLKWKFKCPSCGNVQCAEDFRKFKKQGATSDDAYFNCIGRFTGTKNKIFSKKQPCNYTLGGLFTLHETVVIDGVGNEFKVFEFASETK